MLTVSLLFIFMHLSCVHLATLKIHSVSQSQTQQNFEQRTSPELVNNSGNEAKSLTRIMFLLSICLIWDASMEHLLTRCYQAVWGRTVRKKERAVTGGLGQSELTHSRAKWVNTFSTCACCCTTQYFISYMNSLTLLVKQVRTYLMRTSPRLPASIPSTYSSVLANWNQNHQTQTFQFHIHSWHVNNHNNKDKYLHH